MKTIQGVKACFGMGLLFAIVASLFGAQTDTQLLALVAGIKTGAVWLLD